ncbi:hypothetical protein Forpi1262_v018552 [Fusarium oxysporum f. sp. raphani]|uniref:Uncharacterized protein n=2 Tax=Fusarium oxysporum f. sp. raphani TaxID=96318 RepID=A0A8J5NLL2_FUSOX|nr:hypothetical protein Forpi1262_v018552 [Fusarium oxysporum f. sp. raphani]KAJ0127517.1 FAD-linked oxidoreductase apf9 [Fusarium oxysporum f. sp. albedinis]
MTSPCANYYGSAKCRNSVLVFGARCDFCLTAGAGMPINNLLPHPSTPSNEYVKPMNKNVRKNNAAASKEGVTYLKTAYASLWSVQKLVYPNELGF